MIHCIQQRLQCTARCTLHRITHINVIIQNDAPSARELALYIATCNSLSHLTSCTCFPPFRKESLVNVQWLHEEDLNKLNLQK